MCTYTLCGGYGIKGRSTGRANDTDTGKACSRPSGAIVRRTEPGPSTRSSLWPIPRQIGELPGLYGKMIDTTDELPVVDALMSVQTY